MTQLTRPRCIKWPAMLSVTRVTGRRPRGREGPAQAFEGAPEVTAQRARTERDPHGGGHADRRGAADHHVLDGARHLAVVAVDAVDLARGEEALVEHDHASAAPLDGPDRHASLGGSIPESRAARHP